MMQAPHRVLGWLVTAGSLAALLPVAAPLEGTNRDGRWLRQLCTSTEPADVSMCDAYILGIFDSLVRWGPLPKCMPAGVTDKQAELIVITYLNSDSEDLLLPADLLVTNPTSSYLWRNVIPHLQPLGRCIAPDLIGMGDSDKLTGSGPGSYRFVEHRSYLDALLEALDVRERVTLVIHDWGSALGFDWANRHGDAVKGIAYMEAIVVPQRWDHWDKFNMRPALEGLRSDAGEQMVLEENFFIEKILPGAILRTLTAEEMAQYRRPFAEPGEGRRPTLTWPRQIPIEGEPADVTAIVTASGEWLKTSNVPKLFIKGQPGGILSAGADLDFVRELPAQTEVTVAGIHYVQEDSPHEIGQAIAGWMKALG